MAAYPYSLTILNTTSMHHFSTRRISMMTSELNLGDDGVQDCNDCIGMHLDWDDDRSAVRISQPQKIAETLQEARF